MSLTRTQIISTVLGRLGRREGDTYLVAQAKTELGLIQSRLEGGAFLPWFLLTAESTLTLTANNRELALPANFLREWDDYPIHRYEATGSPVYRKLEKEDFDVLIEEFDGVASGDPVAYALTGTTLNFFTTPNSAYSCRWRYYAKDTALSDSVDTNLWTTNADDLLVAELGVVMAGQYARRVDLAQVFATQKAEAVKRLTAFDIARMQAARSAVRGDRSN